MRIVLFQDIPNLGKKGDIKDVSDGYGRNFLIRRKLAEIATPQIEKRLMVQKVKLEKDAAELKQKSLLFKEKLEKTKLVFKTRMGKSGKAFGSITPFKILAELEKKGINLEKEQILTEPIKTLGKNKVKIKLPQGIEAEIDIVIEPEDSKQQ